MTHETRPPRPTIPAYTPAEHARIADEYAAGEDVYTHETVFRRDGRTETREIDPRDEPSGQLLRISHDRTDAPTCPTASVKWGHILISSAKAQRDELEASVGALEQLSHDDWRAVQRVACKRCEYGITFPKEVAIEAAKGIARQFAQGVYRLGGGHNGVIVEVGGDMVWSIGPEWQGDAEPATRP